MKYKTIEYLFNCYYYQSVWDFFNTDNEIWEDFMKNETKEIQEKLLFEVRHLSQKTSSEINTILNIYAQKAGGISFDTESELLDFLKSLYSFFNNKI